MTFSLFFFFCRLSLLPSVLAPSFPPRSLSLASLSFLLRSSILSIRFFFVLFYFFSPPLSLSPSNPLIFVHQVPHMERCEVALGFSTLSLYSCSLHLPPFSVHLFLPQPRSRLTIFFLYTPSLIQLGWVFDFLFSLALLLLFSSRCASKIDSPLPPSSPV